MRRDLPHGSGLYMLDWFSGNRGKLTKKLRKLERDLQADAQAKIRARAAQYRQEVLKTLAEAEAINQQSQDLSSQLDIEDAKIVRDLVRTNDESVIDIQQFKELERETANEIWFSRLFVSSLGAIVGFSIAPEDLTVPATGAALFGYISTRDDFSGSTARIIGNTGVQVLRKLTEVENKHEVAGRLWSFFLETLEAFLPFDLPGRAPHWRNAYGGEGFLHPDVIPPPKKMRGAEYIEYLNEVERWIKLEKEAVVDKLRSEEDERARKYLEDKERISQVTETLNSALETIGNFTSVAFEKISQEEFSNLLKAKGEDLAQLKERYRELVKRYHPDANPGSDKAHMNEVMTNLSLAYTNTKRDLLTDLDLNMSQISDPDPSTDANPNANPSPITDPNPNSNAHYHTNPNPNPDPIPTSRHVDNSAQMFNRFQQTKTQPSGYRATPIRTPIRTPQDTLGYRPTTTTQIPTQPQVQTQDQDMLGYRQTTVGPAHTNIHTHTHTQTQEQTSSMAGYRPTTGGDANAHVHTQAQEAIASFRMQMQTQGDAQLWNSMKKQGSNLHEQLQKNQAERSKSRPSTFTRPPRRDSFKSSSPSNILARARSSKHP